MERVARTLALGRRRRGETAPAFVVSFDLVGRRLLADRDGAVLLFTDANAANAIAELLEQYGIPRVAIVPCWRSWGGLPSKRRELTDHDEPVQVARAAAEAIAAIAEDALAWLPKELRQ